MRDVTAQNWMLAWFAICTAILVTIFPFILRRRKRRAQREMHDKIEKAKLDILADGVIEGPKGPYVPHKSWDVGIRAGHEPLTDGSTKPPEHKGYYGTG